MHTGGNLLRGTFALFFKGFLDHLAEIVSSSFIFKMRVLITSVTLRKSVSCLNVYLP